MNSSHRSPFHLLNPNSPLIKDNLLLIEATINSKAKMLAMSIAPEIVDLMDISSPRDIVLALQHHPQHLEKMLYTLQFDFQIQADIDIFLKDEDWRMKPKYLHWFRAFSSPEAMPFFVKDKEVRLYMLAGDYLANGRMPIVKRETGPDSFKYMITGGAMLTLKRRLFDTCKMFMFYCHGTDFNPKDAILSMLADYSLPVHYVDIEKQYKKDIPKYARIYSNPEQAYQFNLV